jgi:hypothetical protein
VFGAGFLIRELLCPQQLKMTLKQVPPISSAHLPTISATKSAQTGLRQSSFSLYQRKVGRRPNYINSESSGRSNAFNFTFYDMQFKT